MVFSAEHRAIGIRYIVGMCCQFSDDACQLTACKLLPAGQGAQDREPEQGNGVYGLHKSDLCYTEVSSRVFNQGVVVSKLCGDIKQAKSAVSRSLSLVDHGMESLRLFRMRMAVDSGMVSKQAPQKALKPAL